MLMSQQEEGSSRGDGGGPEYGRGEEEEAGGLTGRASENSAAIAAATALEQETLPPNWYVYTDARGVFYYHNPQLNITQWERPPGAGGDTIGSTPSGDDIIDGGSATEAPIESSTLDLSFAGDERTQTGGGRESSSSSSNARSNDAERTPAVGRGGRYTERLTNGRDGGGNTKYISNGFLSLAASSPADVRQQLQQEDHRAAQSSSSSSAQGGGEGGGGGRTYFSRLSTDTTTGIASSQLQHEYGGLTTATRDDEAGMTVPGGKQQRSRNNGPEDFSWILRCCGCFDLYSALQRLFAVTTDDIRSRLRLALLLPMNISGRGMTGAEGSNPTSSSSSSSSSGSSRVDSAAAGADLLTRPDMYGPFWVATTLVIISFACSNFPLLLFPSAAAAAGAAADVRHLGRAAGAVYGCFMVPPLIVWLGLLYFAPHAVRNAQVSGPGTTGPGSLDMGREESLNEKSTPRLEQLLCLQGYAFVPLCVSSAILLLLQVLPLHIAVIIQWLVTIAAGVVTTVFLLRHMKRLLKPLPMYIKTPCCLLLIGAALLLLFLLMRFAAVGQQQTEKGKLLSGGSHYGTDTGVESTDSGGKKNAASDSALAEGSATAASNTSRDGDPAASRTTSTGTGENSERASGKKMQTNSTAAAQSRRAPVRHEGGGGSVTARNTGSEASTSIQGQDGSGVAGTVASNAKEQTAGDLHEEQLDTEDAGRSAAGAAAITTSAGV